MKRVTGVVRPTTKRVSKWSASRPSRVTHFQVLVLSVTP
jgi:hypothetical protein